MTYSVPLFFLVLGCVLLFAGGFLLGVGLADKILNRKRAAVTVEPQLVALSDALKPVSPRG